MPGHNVITQPSRSIRGWRVGFHGVSISRQKLRTITPNSLGADPVARVVRLGCHQYRFKSRPGYRRTAQGRGVLFPCGSLLGLKAIEEEKRRQCEERGTMPFRFRASERMRCLMGGLRWTFFKSRGRRVS